MISKIKSIFSDTLGVDRAISYTFLARIIQAFSGVLIIFLISFFLNKEEQGFYYTFSSVLAIQIFFELGLGGIITQFVAHEKAKIFLGKDNTLEGNTSAISRLGSLLHFCIKWYLVFAILLFTALIISGFLFFTKFSDQNLVLDWKKPWVIVAFFTSLNLLISPVMAFLQGLGKVKEMSKILLFQQITISLFSWIGLVLGAKLYVLAINSGISVLSLIVLVAITPFPKLLKNIYKVKIVDRIRYKEEIFPYQWKIALSWMSGYFIFQLFNPVIFAFEGAAVAGQMGMTLAALNAILNLILSWTSTKIPMWSSLIAKSDYCNLDKSFFSTLRQSSIISILLLGCFIVFLNGLNFFEVPIIHRFLPLGMIVLLSTTIISSNIVNSYATYLRCHKKEPFLILSIIVGLFCALSLFINIHFWGVNGVIIGYTIISIFVSLPMGYYIFQIKRRAWH